MPNANPRSVEALLTLLKVSLGTSVGDLRYLRDLSCEEWRVLIDLSFDHGISALTANAYNMMLFPLADGTQDAAAPSLLETAEMEDIKYEWLGSILQVESEYRGKYLRTSRLAKALLHKGVECFVLKGMAFASYYTHPEYRECGDSDIYLRRASDARTAADEMKEAGAPSAFETGNRTISDIGGYYKWGTYKHSHLFLGGLLIENHRYLSDFNGTRQGKKTERLLESLLVSSPVRKIAPPSSTASSRSVLLCPGDYFNALFLIKHAHGNFMYGGMNLRMIYDWAALLMQCRGELDWTRLRHDLAECRLLPFAEVLTSICTDYLGVPVGDLSGKICLCTDAALVREIMSDTIAEGILPKASESFSRKCIRISRRFRRIWHYRRLASESYPRMIWNNFAFSSYMKRKIVM